MLLNSKVEFLRCPHPKRGQPGISNLFICHHVVFFFLCVSSTSLADLHTKFSYSNPKSITTGAYNTAIGHDAGWLTTGTHNAAIGNASSVITTGNHNAAIGNDAWPITTGNDNAAVGRLLSKILSLKSKN